MAQGIGVVVKGIKTLDKKLTNFRRQKLEEVPNKAIHDAGFFLEGEIKQSIAGRRVEHKSVDTGTLLRSILTDNTNRLRSIVSTNVKYAKYIEYGTTRIHARMHFRNSKARNEQKIINMVKDRIKKAIKNY